MKLPGGLKVKKKKLSEVYTHEDGWIEGVDLTEPTEIDTPLGKIICENTVRFDKVGALRMCDPVEPMAVETPAGRFRVNRIGWYSNGAVRLCSLVEDQEVETPSGRLRVREGSNSVTSLGWFQSGAMKFCELSEELVQEIETPSGTFEVWGLLSWHENGSIKSCWTGDKTSKISTPHGTLNVSNINWYETGELFAVELRDAVDIEGEHFYSRVGWLQNGSFIGEMNWDHEREELVPQN
ncbi:MAG: hypothetical protein K9L68_14575 [Spirochaetales bacterium]|nr:hypothetical protein [Spirochaetales bacterium]MCF7939814.1 hypothetical protein [Spirochaetales bacterium]